MERALMFVERTLLSINSVLETWFRRILVSRIAIRERKELVGKRVRDREEQIVSALLDRQFFEGELLTVPNLFSLSRIVFGIVLLPMILYDVPAWITVSFFLVAVLTDRLDGVWARIEGETTLGAFLDPVCDKIFFLACLIGFSGTIPKSVFATLLALETVLLVIPFVALHKSFRERRGEMFDIRANMFGKMKFFLECVGIGLLFFSWNALGNGFLIAAVYFAFLSIVRKAERIFA